jgi:hypothetical protein
MDNRDLERVRADLATIRQVAGITSQPRAEDVVTSYLIALAGVLCAVWTIVAREYGDVWGLSALLLPLAYVTRDRMRNSADKGGSPQVRSEFAESLRVLWLALPFCGYALWALHMQIPPKLVLATGVFFVGTLMVSSLSGAPRRLELVPYCIAFMAGALAVPAMPISPVLIIGLMLAAAGSCSGAWLQRKLKLGAADEFAD